MWKCSLRVVKDKVLEGTWSLHPCRIWLRLCGVCVCVCVAGLPDFEGELSYTNAGIRTHRAHLTAATNLRYVCRCVCMVWSIIMIDLSLASLRASLMGLRASLEENIKQLETELKNLRDTPLSMCVGEDPALPQILVPEITVPVSALL